MVVLKYGRYHSNQRLCLSAGDVFRAGQVQVEERNTGTPLLLDVAATDSSNEAMAMRWLFSIGNQLRETWKTWHAQAHVITDGLAAPEARLMPLLGFLMKALREANFPTLLAQKADFKLCPTQEGSFPFF